jgi:hypothetical protein
MQKKQWIFLCLAIMFIIILFIRGWYLDNKRIEDKIEGILLSKSPGNRGSFTIYLYNSATKTNTKHVYNKLSIFEKLVIKDSIFKNNNSPFLKVFRKKNDLYHFVDSFDISRW